jgi:hypothetical protein
MHIFASLSSFPHLALLEQQQQQQQQLICAHSHERGRGKMLNVEGKKVFLETVNVHFPVL